MLHVYPKMIAKFEYYDMFLTCAVCLANALFDLDFTDRATDSLMNFETVKYFTGEE